MPINESFIQERIMELIANSGESERSFSYKLGRSHGYLSNITAGRALPSMNDFLEICNLLQISPKDFFDNEMPPSNRIHKAINGLKKLNKNDLDLVLSIIDRLQTK